MWKWYKALSYTIRLSVTNKKVQWSPTCSAKGCTHPPKYWRYTKLVLLTMSRNNRSTSSHLENNGVSRGRNAGEQSDSTDQLVWRSSKGCNRSLNGKLHHQKVIQWAWVFHCSYCFEQNWWREDLRSYWWHPLSCDLHMRHAHCDQEGSEALLVHHVKKCLEVYQKPRGSFSPFDRSSDFPSAFQPNKLVVPNILQWMRQRRWNQHLRYGKDLQEKKRRVKILQRQKTGSQKHKRRAEVRNFRRESHRRGDSKNGFECKLMLDSHLTIQTRDIYQRCRRGS